MYADPALLDDREFMVQAIPFYDKALHLAGASVCLDRDLGLLAAAAGHCPTIMKKDPALYADKQVVLAFLQRASKWSLSSIFEAIKGSDLLKDKEVLAAVMNLGLQECDLKFYFGFYNLGR